MPPTTLFSLEDHHIVALSGRDALAFAQSQTMNDVAALRDGEWQWNGWLSAKGRVIALFALLRIDADTVWLLLPDADPEDFAAQLRRFVFRSKVAIAVRGDLAVAGRVSASLLASGNHWAGDPSDAIELDFSGAIDATHPGRSLRISPHAPVERDEQRRDEWRRIDLEHGLPRLDVTQSAQWTPQQLSLERLRAFSVKKGCYPGQEIVARTHFLGQAKRGLSLIQSQQPLVPGMDLPLGEQASGTVISVCGDLALAVTPLADAGHAPPQGAFWSTRPMREGLAR